eukprot:CAMPEP_0114594854 /NCGR_PEP_ID=MMETSP0125-20121206/16568_1 /TAXON_ID=485358 ORGANISM="Aristerostoma sp., Strain ATCC 50986" /NCGR_SAMPLE_ID=MMETSP0125 /ASSEMBLY_ACC=CAM_ASM_000245 /LENGTH=182 /DNA_ID=CAMNT_0001795689 /DNA_START=436 /DNA_END=984 /DNA_ORIENTATION=-
MSKKIPNTDQVVRTYFHQLIDGIEFLHENDYAHLDLKLDNILMSDEYGLKIADFDSCVKVQPEMKITSEGSCDYRAPEIIKKTCEKPHAADIYSAGIMLFVMKNRFFPCLEGKKVKGKDMHALMLDNPKEFWEQWDVLTHGNNNMSQEFKELFMLMVKKDPEERASIEEVKNSRWYKGPILS